MYNDSDEYEFNPASSSKLAALFGNTKLSDDFNSSLTYTAPKQPQVRKEPELNESAKNKPQSSVLIAKVVSLWKLEDKDYKSLGKHGLAVIGSTELNLYEVIAYKEKNNILLRIKVNDKYSLCNKKDYFSTFYDNDNQNWLVKFENSNDQNTFCQTIQTHGAKIIDSTEETPQNDKTQTNTVKEIKIKSEFPSKETPGNEVEVNSDSSGSHKRANILSRMAKMGQQILPSPLVKSTSTDVSDSELDDTQNDRKVPPRKFKRAIHTEKNVSPKEDVPQLMQPNYLENQMVPCQPNYNNYSPQFPQNVGGPLYYNPPMAPMQYDGFHNFIMSQNADLKMNLAQISAKLDSALGQNIANRTNTDESALKSKIKVLQLKVSNLEEELVRYDRKYCNLERTYRDLEEKHHEHKAGYNDSEAVIQSLRAEIDKLHANLRERDEKIAAQEILQNELEKCQNTIYEHENIIKSQEVKIKGLEQFYEKNKDNMNLQLTVDELTETISGLKVKIKEHEEYYQRTEDDKQKSIKKNDKIVSTFNDKIKEHMNNMYQSILANFQEDTSYSLSDVKFNVAQNLKGTTFKIIDELNSVYKNEDIE